MSVLVTGAAGFIGSHLCETLAHDGHEVVGIDNFSTGKAGNLTACLYFDNFRCYVDNIERPQLLHSYKKRYPDLDTVFHLAGITSVSYSIAHEQQTMETNQQATSSLLIEAEGLGFKSFIFAGSAAEYGNAYRETGLVEADANEVNGQLSPYGRSKYLASRFMLSSPIGTSLRFFNVYGPRQTNAYGGVIPCFLHQLYEDGHVTIEGDGTQTRDFLYVEDAVNAYIAAWQESVHGIYNVCSGESLSILDLASAVEKTMVLGDGHTKFVDARAGDIKHSKGDATAFKSATRWSPKVSPKEGLSDTYWWFEDPGEGR